MSGGDHTGNRATDLSILVDMERPESVFRETRAAISMVYPDYDFSAVRRVFEDIVKLFEGKYLGYRRCNTQYHDLMHTTDVLLCIARLIHGLRLDGQAMSGRIIGLGLISALMHDTGYIQGADDLEGTGARYAMVHTERSLIFTKNHFERNGFPASDYGCACRLISATDPDMELKDIPFESAEEEAMGKALFACNLLGQMADRLYLEKLLFLFGELNEAGIAGVNQEDELLKSTLRFYEVVRERIKSEAGYSGRYMRNHFSARWNIDIDLYAEAMEKNIVYLGYILENHGKDYRERLNRGGVVKRIREKEKPKTG